MILNLYKNMIEGPLPELTKVVCCLFDYEEMIIFFVLFVFFCFIVYLLSNLFLCGAQFCVFSVVFLFVCIFNLLTRLQLLLLIYSTSPFLIFSLQFNKSLHRLWEMLFQLRNLMKLDLSRNRFTGEVPSSIAKLVRLEKLILQNNLLTGKPFNRDLHTSWQAIFFSYSCSFLPVSQSHCLTRVSSNLSPSSCFSPSRRPFPTRTLRYDCFEALGHQPKRFYRENSRRFGTLYYFSTG